MNTELLRFLSAYPIHSYGKGKVILRPEQEENQIFFLSSGFVRAHTITEEGNEFSAVLLGPGMYFPVFRDVSDSEYPKKLATKYYYSALTTTRIVSVNAKDLVPFLTSHSQITVEVADIYYRNLQLLQSKLEFMAYTHNAYKKVCYFLLFLCQKFGQQTSSGVKLTPPLTQKEFATFVGLSRESVSHQLSALKKKAILQEFHPLICISSTHSLEDELRK